MGFLGKQLSDLGGRLSRVWQLGQRAPQGRVFELTPEMDALREYYSDNLNPKKLFGLLRAIDGGDLATTLGLFEEMEEKDLHLQGVANTRRNALNRLEWEVVSAAEDDGDLDFPLAKEAAAFVAEEIECIEGFEESLEHFTTAIGTNLAVAELVWERDSLAAIEPIPSDRLRMKMSESMDVRVVTRDNREGVIAQAPKFVVHIPYSRAGFPFKCTIAEAQAIIYLIKGLAVKDWAAYVETFGMPVRWGMYKRGATKEERDEAIKMLRNMASHAFGLFSEAIELKLIESSGRATAPYKEIIDWCERKQSIGWIGQHLTADTSGSTGTYSAAQVQEEVRQDLLEDDVKREARSIRRHIFEPMVLFKFPGRRAPVPKFKRIFREAIDREKEARVISAAQQAGIRVPKKWAHDRVGVPEPKGDEPFLEPSTDLLAEGVVETFGGGEV